jgi:hypothetical protein
MWYNQDIRHINPLEAKSKPFKSEHKEQIKLVNSFDWLDLQCLEGASDKFREIYKPSRYMDTARIDRLLFAFRKRVEELRAVLSVFF